MRNRAARQDFAPRGSARGLIPSILAIATSLIVACGGPDEAVEVPLRSVRYTLAEPGDGARWRTFSGTSSSSQRSRLSFKVSGTIDALPIAVGDALRRGQLIARLDPALYELEAQQAEANLVQTQAAERNAAASYERTKGLYADNNASRNDLDASRANAESAQAQVRAAEKQLELARLNIDYTVVTAASDCSVAAVEVEVNENVSAGSTIAIVNCGAGLDVDLAIPESLIGSLRPSMTATIRFSSLPGETFTGKVAEVGVAAGEGATFPVTVSIDGVHPELRTGLAAEVSFAFGDGGRGEVFLLPLSAVVHDSSSTFVYVAEPAGTAGEAIVVRRSIELGELTEMGVEITSGLSPGERVITAGTTVIREGLRVALQDEPRAADRATDAAP